MPRIPDPQALVSARLTPERQPVQRFVPPRSQTAPDFSDALPGPFEQLGQLGGAVTELLGRVQQRRDQLEAVRSENQIRTALAGLSDETFNEAREQQDIASAPNLFQERARNSVARILNQVNNPLTRENLQLVAERAITLDTVNLASRVARQQDQDLAELADARIEQAVEDFALAESDSVRELNRRVIESQIQGLVDAGLLQEEVAQVRLRNSLQEGNFQRIKLLLAQERIGQAERELQTADLAPTERAQLLSAIESAKVVDLSGARNVVRNAQDFLALTGRLPAELDSAVAQLEANAPEEGAQARQMVGALKEAQATLGLPLPDKRELVRRERERLAAKSELSINDVTRLQVFEDFLSGIERQTRNEPLLQAIREGVFSADKLGVLDLQAGFDSVTSQLQVRDEFAAAAERLSGLPSNSLSGLFEPERDALENLLKSEPSLRAETFRALLAGLGNERTQLLVNEFKFNSPATAAAFSAMPEDFQLADRIFEGAAIIDSDTSMKLPESNIRARVMSEVLGDTLRGETGESAVFEQGALALCASRAASTGTREVSAEDFSGCLQTVVGGTLNVRGEPQGGGVVETSVIGGHKVIKRPRSMSDGEFRDNLSALTVDVLAKVAGSRPMVATATGEPRPLLTEELPDLRFNLIDDGGTYSLTVVGPVSGVEGAVQDERGNPFEVNLPQAFKLIEQTIETAPAEPEPIFGGEVLGP